MEPNGFAILTFPRTLGFFCSRAESSFAHARVPLKHGRHTRVASCRTAVLGCIEAPPSSSRLTAAFAPQFLLPTCRAINASPPSRGSRSARTWPPPNSPRAVHSAAGLRPLPSPRRPLMSITRNPPAHQLGRGLSSPCGNAAMRCTPPLCMSLPCSSMLCIAPPPSFVAGPALRFGFTASQVPPRPPSPSYRRASLYCPPRESVSSRHASALSAHLRAASAARCHTSTRADPSLQHLPPRPFRRCRTSAPSRTTFACVALHCTHCGSRSPLFGAQPLPPATPTWCCSLARYPS
jgi:hypothetical protein